MCSHLLTTFFFHFTFILYLVNIAQLLRYASWLLLRKGHKQHWKQNNLLTTRTHTHTHTHTPTHTQERQQSTGISACCSTVFLTLWKMMLMFNANSSMASATEINATEKIRILYIVVRCVLETHSRNDCLTRNYELKKQSNNLLYFISFGSIIHKEPLCVFPRHDAQRPWKYVHLLLNKQKGTCEFHFLRSVVRNEGDWWSEFYRYVKRR